MKENDLKSPATTLPAGVTVEMAEAWKARYGNDKVKIASLQADDDATEYVDVCVRVPDRKTMSEVEKWIDKSPDRAKEVLINACVLSGKDMVKADDGLFMAAWDALTKLMPVRTAIIKNL